MRCPFPCSLRKRLSWQPQGKDSLSNLLSCKVKIKSSGPCLLEGKEILVIKESKVVIYLNMRRILTLSECFLMKALLRALPSAAGSAGQPHKMRTPISECCPGAQSTGTWEQESRAAPPPQQIEEPRPLLATPGGLLSPQHPMPSACTSSLLKEDSWGSGSKFVTSPMSSNSHPHQCLFMRPEPFARTLSCVP